MSSINYTSFLIFFTYLSAYTFHDDLIPMTFGGNVLEKPFLGGFNRPKIQWLDSDTDGDIDIVYCNSSKANIFLDWYPEKTLYDICHDTYNFALSRYKNY